MNLFYLRLRMRLGMKPPKGAFICPFCWNQGHIQDFLYLDDERKVNNPDEFLRNPVLLPDGTIHQRTPETPILWECDTHRFWGPRHEKFIELKKRQWTEEKLKQQNAPAKSATTWFVLGPPSAPKPNDLAEVDPNAPTPEEKTDE